MKSATLETCLEAVENGLQLRCRKCGGTGHRQHRHIYAEATDLQQGTTEPCYVCDGRKFFDPPNLSDLWKQIKGRKRPLRFKRPDDPRAYFLWRMVRFHTGDDVCMPVMAQTEIDGDPFEPILDAWAEAIAQRLTGRESYGRGRWRSALYGEPQPEPMNLAQALGAVHDGHKPASEALELI